MKHEEYTQETLEQHLREEHHVSPIGEYIKEIVYGGNDGIVTTFAVIAGFTGANAAGQTASIGVVAVLLFGLANLFADGAAMGLGNFLSIRSQQDMYRNMRATEAREVEHSEETEKVETAFLLTRRGFSQEQANTLTEIFSQNKEFWIDFMMEHELEMPNPERENPLFNGIATFVAFVFFGFIPLAPYFVITDISQAFIVSCVMGCGALVLLGFIRGIVSKRSLPISIAETLLIGGTAAGIAFWVGTFFK